MAVPVIDKVKSVIELCFRPKILNALLSQWHSGYLKDVGWFNSFEKLKPVDKNYKPIPWCTYPFIDFIEPRLNKNISIFEFGAGYSTLFFAERTKDVTAVEHNEFWYNQMKKNSPQNVELIFSQLDKEKNYSKILDAINKKFDIIFVDAEQRNECMINSIAHLSSEGIIVLDDSEREEYAEGISFLQNGGFRQIDFWGIAPECLYKKSTTIFYRPDNCLSI